jgi:HlyB family type I secretion system ABC transporter
LLRFSAASARRVDGRNATGQAAVGRSLVESFARLCAHLDRPLPEIELRAASRESDDAQLDRLVRLAERLGLEAQTLPATIGRLRRAAPPYLLVDDQGHQAWFIRARIKTRLMLVDPLKGGSTTPTTLKAAAAMGSRILQLRARRQATTDGRQLWRRAIWQRLKPVFLEVGIASVCINLLALAMPLFMMTVYNKVIGQGALGTLDVLAIGMVTLFGFELLLRSLRGYVVSHTGARLDLALSSEVVHHLLRLPYRVFEAMPQGQLMERLRQLDQLRTFLSGNLPLLLVDFAFVGLFIAAIFVFSPLLGWVTLVALPLFIGLSAIAQLRQGRLLRANFRAVSKKSAGLAETVSQALTVKALALEPEMQRRFEDRQVESAWTGFRASRLANGVAATGQVLQHVVSLVVIYLGARMIVAGELTIGALIACTILSARALAPMRQIFFAWHQLQQSREALARLGDLMGERPEQLGAALPLPNPLHGRFRFEAVSFSYDPAKPPALQELDLSIEPGSMLAVVGPPGSGKSTLAKLLIGLEKPDFGRVLVDDVDIARLDPAEYRAQLGVVPQEIQLFAGSIAENIGIAAVDRSMQRIVAAAKFVGIHDTIQRLPDGYDTNLGERGNGLSLGQRQLLCIARALVRNPRLLVLDEATSALDLASEAYLLRNLKRAGSGRTIVMVTHRLSVIEMCDRAILLEAGRLVMAGHPREVVRRARQPINESEASA